MRITGIEENEYVLKLVKKREPSLKRVWIGLKYNQEVKKFLWSDNAVPYFRHWPNSPERGQHSSKRCVYMSTSRKFEQRKAPGSWNDVTCVSLYGFVCKKLQ